MRLLESLPSNEGLEAMFGKVDDLVDVHNGQPTPDLKPGTYERVKEAAEASEEPVPPSATARSVMGIEEAATTISTSISTDISA